MQRLDIQVQIHTCKNFKCKLQAYIHCEQLNWLSKIGGKQLGGRNTISVRQYNISHYYFISGWGCFGYANLSGISLHIFRPHLICRSPQLTHAAQTWELLAIRHWRNVFGGFCWFHACHTPPHAYVHSMPICTQPTFSNDLQRRTHSAECYQSLFNIDVADREKWVQNHLCFNLRDSMSRFQLMHTNIEKKWRYNMNILPRSWV